jgi:hypothetical protein
MNIRFFCFQTVMLDVKYIPNLVEQLFCSHRRSFYFEQPRCLFVHLLNI